MTPFGLRHKLLLLNLFASVGFLMDVLLLLFDCMVATVLSQESFFDGNQWSRLKITMFGRYLGGNTTQIVCLFLAD